MNKPSKWISWIYASPLCPQLKAPIFFAQKISMKPQTPCSHHLELLRIVLSRAPHHHRYDNHEVTRSLGAKAGITSNPPELGFIWKEKYKVGTPSPPIHGVIISQRLLNLYTFSSKHMSNRCAKAMFRSATALAGIVSLSFVARITQNLVRPFRSTLSLAPSVRTHSSAKFRWPHNRCSRLCQKSTAVERPAYKYLKMALWLANWGYNLYKWSL